MDMTPPTRSAQRHLADIGTQRLRGKTSSRSPKRRINTDRRSGRSTTTSRPSSDASPPNKDWIDERIQRQDAIVRMAVQLRKESSSRDDRRSTTGAGSKAAAKGTFRLMKTTPRRSKSLDQDEDWYDSSKLDDRERVRCSLIERVASYVDDSSVAGLSLSSTSSSSIKSTQSGLALIDVVLSSQKNSTWDI
ncbi:unnamed protein product [Cylindrotheca closterium]|uniref:Uncharacterized protein n=1 Tax=Cylindrotheca closterium TaxID=2856 RepID=A0AAD2CV84_9STRA|nr:unnamed protein product [Cylindrotheca closterium]